MTDSQRASKWNKDHKERRKVIARHHKWKIWGIVNSEGKPFQAIDYDRAYQIQQGCCKGCNKHQSEMKGRLQADHDHKTGKFRFLLCMNCNRTLGHAQDNPEILRRLATNLEAI